VLIYTAVIAHQAVTQKWELTLCWAGVLEPELSIEREVWSLFRFQSPEKLAKIPAAPIARHIAHRLA
jgi:hypothetical protein